jgi:hypothetical protein
MHRRVSLLCLMVIALVLPIASPASATEPPGGSVAYRKAWILCANQDGFIDIGGQVFIKEFVDSHVNQFRVKWLLYNTANPTSTTLAYKRWTVESAVFPENGQSYSWTTPKQRWEDMIAPDAGYTLVAKLTWVRPGRKDWNHRFPFVRCS